DTETTDDNQDNVKEDTSKVVQGESADKKTEETSSQNKSAEQSRVLRNKRSTRLPDGRVSVDVSTFEELKSAFNTPSIG
ncbi:hypothetical protein ACQ10C_16355, partial [Enterococcus faecalis]|uniref:hypothetical protein n=1 Tax=Enterococcus faecalis TaxID=1351 RepID=UPI003D6B2A59